jgi:hypothetical protein
MVSKCVSCCVCQYSSANRLPVVQMTSVLLSCVLYVCVYVSPLFVQFHCRELLPTIILKIIVKPQMSYECGGMT